MNISEPLETIFLFSHSNRIDCLIKDTKVQNVAGEITVKETLKNKKYFNNITFHIKTDGGNGYEITVVDSGSIESTKGKIGNDELDFYRDDKNDKDDKKLIYLKILDGNLTESLKANNITSIIISRHGQGRHNTYYNLGVTDARLTDKGIKDTTSTAVRVKELISHLQPTHVFTSELFRTMQTAAIFMKELDYLKTLKAFYIVRCNHELSGDQIKNKSYLCDSNLPNTLKDTSSFDKLKSIRGEENYPKRLYEKMELDGLNGLNKGGIVEIKSEELNCSISRYRKTCKKGSEMFDNIIIVFNSYKEETDCKDYAVFSNIKAIIEDESIGGGQKRKSTKRNRKKGGRTLLRKSKRFTKKRNKRKTNKKRTNKKRTNKKR
jgi:bisphosphoglycerate-dependent phosphoglycerate mutase